MRQILPQNGTSVAIVGTIFERIGDNVPQADREGSRGVMTVSSILSFWAVAFLLIAVPGADWAFTISASLRGYAVLPAVLPAVGGLVLGYTMVTVVVAGGVGAVVAGTPAILTGLTVAGGGYLMWHGAMTFARPATPAAPTSPAAMPITNRAVLVKGVAVSGLNPKALLLFLALLPQFTDRHRAWPVAAQIAVLGLVFTLTCAIFYLALGLLTRTILHTRPATARTVSRVAGAAMVVIGGALLGDRLVA
jgi:threonine/homoserine/homoserine lactone efflux protein